jgi:glucose-1-phosphate thymidylyltransferase
MKGIILAGGSGSRLRPATNSINKHILPIYDKPMIYYSLSNLLLTGCREILIVSTEQGIKQISEILGGGDQLGISIEYIKQSSPDGIPSAINECKPYLNEDDFWVNLGDNFIFGSRIKELYSESNLSKNCSIFLKEVGDIWGLGEAIVKNNSIENLIEKPNKNSKGYAITGLYKFNYKFFEYFQKIKISQRGETEIVDILKQYLLNEELEYSLFGRGVSWIDAGTNDDLLKVSNFVQNFQEINSTLICSPEEISFNLKYITKEDVLKNLNKYVKNSEYTEILTKLIS